MGDVSKNFSREEFACNCGCGFAAVDIALLCGLQELRDKSGKSITISSGCRCDERNKRVRGSSKSFHKFGMAADITIAGLTPAQMAALADKVPEFQRGAIITYTTRGFIHVDVRGKKYREVR